VHRWIAIQLQPPPPLLRGLVDQRQRAAIGGVDAATAAEVMQGMHAIPQVLRTSRIKAQRVAAIEQGGDIAGECALVAARTHQQVGDARMGAEREQLPAMRGDAGVAVERIERLQQGDRRGLRRWRRRVEQTQRVRAPLLEFEHERGEFGACNLRPRARFQALAFRPQSIAPAFGDTAGAAGALGRGRLRNAHRVEPTHAATGIQTRLAREPGVDDHAHTGQGHARLGDIGREHDAAPIAGAQHARLFLDRQLAVQQQHLGFHIAEHACTLLEFELAGQETQQIAGMLRQGLLHRALELERQRLLRPRREMRRPSTG
jgi:hypothetical protein